MECNSKWNIVVKSKSEMIIQLDKIKLEGDELINKKIRFKDPQDEWCSFWNDKKNEWLNHPMPIQPLEELTEVTAKTIASRFKISFGGNHSIGWSRWGFTYSKAELIN